MYFSQDAVHHAIIDLENVQPFYGTTFLVCKQNKLPVGNPIPFAISQKETDFFNVYYKPISESAYFFRVFRPSDKNKFWLDPNYSSTGSQSTRTQKFGPAFLHPKKSNLWAWSDNYINILKENLQNSQLIPTFSLVVWLYRDRNWDVANPNMTLVLNTFIEEFSINNVEIDTLFKLGPTPIQYIGSNLWSDEKYDWNLLKGYFSIPLPQDAPIERIRSLQKLHIENIGPAQTLDLDFGRKLNIITGDNGLGKTFILEIIWWALTDTWTGDPIQPIPLDAKPSQAINSKINPIISFQLEGDSGTPEYYQAYYNRLISNWQKTEPYSAHGLVVYARADGLFAVMDPSSPPDSIYRKGGKTIVFRKEDIWEGISSSKDDVLTSARGFTSRICNGLLTDWISWQQSNDESFHLLKKVLEKLSPPKTGDLGPITPGHPVRISRDSRLIPTVRHAYGEVPVLYASEGVKRILALAYLIVWTWQEHKINSSTIQQANVKNLVFMIDEVETHLHPQWQRRILPALMDMFQEIDSEITVQFITSTHSPIVLSSIENLFDEEKDKLFHLDIVEDSKGQKNAEVYIKDVEFEKRGTVDSWLTSQIFELKQPRGSIKTEEVITKAVKIQLSDNVTSEQVLKITKELQEVLSAHDKFWVRWRSFADRYNVDV